MVSQTKNDDYAAKSETAAGYGFQFEYVKENRFPKRLAGLKASGLLRALSSASGIAGSTIRNVKMCYCDTTKLIDY